MSDETVWTPIMVIAMAKGCQTRPAEFAAAARLLLEHGADPNDDETGYHVAEGYQNDVMRAIVESGKCNANTLVTMLGRKHDWHDYEGIKWLLEHGGGPQSRQRLGPHRASQGNRAKQPTPFLRIAPRPRRRPIHREQVES